MRVYLPGTSTIAAHLVDSGLLVQPVAEQLTGFAVTAGLRAYYDDPDTDLEELEYAALTAAARASLRLIDADPAAWRRRVVFAADVPDRDVTVRDDLDAGAVQISVPVELGQIASVHLDDVDAAATVAGAAAAILPADLGDVTAQEAVDDAEGNELSWYATQELSLLLELD